MNTEVLWKFRNWFYHFGGNLSVEEMKIDDGSYVLKKVCPLKNGKGVLMTITFEEIRF